MAAIFALLLVLMVFVLIVGGVVANLYLYSRGAFGRRGQDAESAGGKELDPKVEARYYMHVSTLGESTEEYARRVVSGALIAVVVLIAVMVLFWQSLLH